MGHIYRNLREIPIPDGGRINHYDMKVSVYRTVDGKRRRTIIGAATSETTMIPNENFRTKFPALWQEYYKSETPPMQRMSVGLYGLILSIGWRTGLYPDLQDAFGPQYANAALDFAMYSIRERSSTAQLFESDMADHLLFSRKAYSDSWYSNFFTTMLTRERIDAFKAAWLKRCAAKAVKAGVWLCIDGSNNDCAVKDSALVEKGHGKSHRETNIVSYIWAVDAATGRPVTWFVNNGAMPDCKAIDEMIRVLAASGIKVDGVILDRGFVSLELLDLIEEKDLPYIVMLKSNNVGFIEMMERHSNTIRWRVDHFVRSGIFGITDQVKLFKCSRKPSCVGLYFVGMSHAGKAVKLMDRVIRTADELSAKIKKNPMDVEVPVELQAYLSILRDQNGAAVDVEFNFAAWQAAVDRVGYHAIASSSERSAREIHELYRLRDVSEKQFSQLKTQLDDGVTRVHSDSAIEARFAEAFIASILRTEIHLACEAMDLDTNEMIRKIDDAHLMRMPNGLYEEIRSLPRRCRDLLKAFGLSEDHFKKFADEINETAATPVYQQVRQIPDVKRRGPGRPKGSKNKKTLEREAAEKANPHEEVPKRGRGRPKGSKNKATLEREAAQSGLPEPPKRKPGRPKGSKNKKTLEREAREAALAAAAAQPKRGPGRPKGRKNNATLEREAREAEAAKAAAKRGPGRPKGSKNRPKPIVAAPSDPSNRDDVGSS